MKRTVERAGRPLLHLLHVRLGLRPDQVSWIAFGWSVAAAITIGSGRLGVGLIFMAVGQFFDGLDGAIAREFGLTSAEGHRLDTILDRASETLIFLSFGVAGLAPFRLVFLAIFAVLLLTTICDRSRLDIGAKRVVLYAGYWIPFPILFEVILSVNLAAYIIGLLRIDCELQVRMDRLGGDLDTVASRALALEAAEAAVLFSEPLRSSHPHAEPAERLRGLGERTLGHLANRDAIPPVGRTDGDEPGVAAHTALDLGEPHRD
jgi:phosphatidylglycerophosphate synthase